MNANSRPPATRKDHRAFCETEGWALRTSARGKSGQDHVKFELGLADGSVLRTRISHPVNRSSYAPSMWNHILREQLMVDADTFWMCVTEGVVPLRSRPPAVKPSLPASLVRQLILAGVAEKEIAGMSIENATARMTAIWAAAPPER